jgi:hypothetical protein
MQREGQRSSIVGAITLQLSFSPGGTRRVTASAASLGLADVPMTYLAPKDYAVLANWKFVYVVNRRLTVTRVIVLTTPRPAVVELTIWNPAGRVVAASGSPVIATGALPAGALNGDSALPGGIGVAEFKIPRLRGGKYALALSSDRRVVATGAFTVPCHHIDRATRRDARHYGHIATGECLGGGELRYVGKQPSP